MTSHLMLVHAEPFDRHLTPRVTYTAMVSRNQLTTTLPPIASSSYWGEGWTELAPDSNVAVYSDATLDNVFGLGGVENNGPKPMFYPHADGAPDYVFGANSDFRVMEDELCRWLRFSGQSDLPTRTRSVCLSRAHDFEVSYVE
jgi:hypothetical protein